MTKLLLNIDVDDLARGVEFYVAALGLRIGRRLGDSIVELLGAAVPIYILEKQEGRDYARHWTPVHLDVEVEDLEAALERAERAGARRETEIAEHPWGSIVTVRDPFGHGLCFLRFSERGYDAIAT